MTLDGIALRVLDDIRNPSSRLIDQTLGGVADKVDPRAGS